MSEEKKKTDSAPTDVMGFLDYYLVKKAPFQIPDNAKEWIAQYSPWITLVIMVLFAPLILAAIGLSAIFAPFALMGGATGFGLTTIVLIVQLGLMGFALPGLFARKLSGWTLLFYSEIASLVYGLVYALTSVYGLSGLVGALIGLYVIFQIREKYTK